MSRLQRASALLAAGGLSLFAALASPAALATEAHAIVEAVVAKARRMCAAFDGGTLDVGPDALSRPDLDGDGQADVLIDHAGLRCSNAAGLFCGSAGCHIVAVIGDRSVDLFAQRWAVARFDGRPVLLLQRHGNFCGRDRTAPCIEALVWHDGRFLTP
jgi:hypothetical protein